MNSTIHSFKLFIILTLISQQFIFAQEKNAAQVYKDDTYKFQFSYPANFVYSKVNNERIQLREKKDIESTTRISISILNFETTSATGKLFDFAQFVRAHSKKLYLKNNIDNVDSLIVKDYTNSQSIKGKEVYVRLVNNAQQSSTGKEDQIIKGPVFLFDISSKTGIPGTALVIYQVTDDSKTSRVMRAIVDELKFGDS